MARATQDALGVLRGLQMIAEAVCQEQNAHTKHIWLNSSVRELLEKQLKQTVDQIRATGAQPSVELKKLQHCLQETGERTFVVISGIKQLAEAKAPKLGKCDFSKAMSQTLGGLGPHVTPDGVGESGTGTGSSPTGGPSGGVRNKTATKLTSAELDAANLDISSITLEELEDILSKRNQNRNISLRTSHTKSKQVPSTEEQVKAERKGMSEAKSSLPPSPAVHSAAQTIKPPAIQALKKEIVPDTSTLERTGLLDADTKYVDNLLKLVAGTTSTTAASINNNRTPVAPLTKAAQDLPELSKVAKQRRVPASRLGRMASFGGLFAGLGLGTLNELAKGALGLGGSLNMRDAVLSPANAERIVDTLCKVRGAALKIGQILSIQDTNVVSPQLAKAFERVRQAADYMPDWQVERVLSTQLGPDWRDKMAAFDMKPFAAASIGQVHRATLKDGMQVAIKIQYPGVAQSIESDIDNLVGMLKVWDVFPQGFFIDNVVRVAKRELIWEVDYKREAEYTEKFKEMIAAYPEYYVPSVINSLTTSSILTTELVPGVPLDKCFDLSYEHRKHIAGSVLKLCLRELFEIQCMQTDPNWSNFLYNAPTKRLMLIDFGSTRFYQQEFIKNYRHVIICAANDDRQGVLDMSLKMGFLTGYESKQMEKAHVDAVMILGEIFRFDGDFDFGKQNTTQRLAQLVPTMVAHRLCPPPEEIYSIHRKLSGIFLLCARLNVTMNCRPFYDEIILNKYKA